MGVVACGVALALACGRPELRPEDHVRATLASLESAAEGKDVAAFKEWISERYLDAQGQDRQAVGALVAFHFLQNRSVYLLTRVPSVEIGPPGEARAEVLVAMAGTPIETPAALVDVRADLWRFAVVLREEERDTWRVTSAEWRPATVADFQ